MKNISAIHPTITENKENLRAPKINYWKTHKPVRFVLSYVCFVHYTARQAKNSMKSFSAIHPAITENTDFSA